MSINLKFFSLVLFVLFTLSSSENENVMDENDNTKSSLIGRWKSTSYITGGVEQSPQSLANIVFKENNTYETLGDTNGFGITFTGNYVISEEGTKVLFKDNVASIGVAGNITYTISDLTDDAVVRTSTLSVITLKKD